MARIRLAAFDLDGTLLREDKTPSPHTLETLERVLDRASCWRTRASATSSPATAR